MKKQAAAKTIGALWALWLEDRAKDGFSNTLYEHNWKTMQPFFAHRTPATLTRDDCRTWARQRFAAGRSPWTVNTQLARLRACMHWAAENNYLQKAPPVWVPSRGKHRTRVLSFDEVRKLIEGAGDPHVYLFIVLAVTTGARHMAILDLIWDRVDFEKGLISYDENLPPDPMSKAWRKGRATVPLGRVAREALERAFKGRQTTHVIEHGGKRLKSVREGFANATQRAGLGTWAPHPEKPDVQVWKTDVTPHTLRHTVATWSRERGVELARVAQLLGHADERTTSLIYTHADPHRFLGGAVGMIDENLENDGGEDGA